MLRAEPTRGFLRDYQALPQPVKAAFDRKLTLFVHNARHLSLRPKRVQGTEDYWEVSITMSYRVVLRFLTEDSVELVRVGTHRVLDHL